MGILAKGAWQASCQPGLQTEDKGRGRGLAEKKAQARLRAAQEAGLVRGKELFPLHQG